MHSKLARQLTELQEAGVISPETVQNISSYYSKKRETKPNRLFTIFGVIGALLSGLGIILIIAHNWDGMPKTLKTILAFIPLCFAQIMCAFGFIQKKGAAWIESSTTFLILSVGATIALISQIYHIPGDLSDFLLIWVIITAPLLYLLRSNMALIIHLVLTTWYACDLGYFFNGEIPWWYLPLFLGVIPRYLQLQKETAQSNSSGLLNWLLPLSPIIVLGSFTNGHSLSFVCYIAFFGLLYNIGQLPLFKSQGLRRNGYAVMGSLGSVVLLTFLTFEWFWKDVIHESHDQQELLVTVTLFLAGILVLGYSLSKKLLGHPNLFQFAFLIVGALYATHHLGWAHNVILTNVLVAALGIVAIRIGIRKSSFGVLNYGLLILTALITSRFFDTNLDFIVRGILFISVGAGFFFTNYLLIRKQRNRSLKGPSKTENHD